MHKSVAADTMTAEFMAARALKDPSLIPGILDGLASPTSLKLRCAKALNLISVSQPELLYPHFDFFMDLLSSPHRILKWNAISILSNLAVKDPGHKFEAVFGTYYSHMKDGDLITAANIAAASGKIATARPELRRIITEELLSVDFIQLPTEECREIARGKALEAFICYAEDLKVNKPVGDFIKRCLSSRRPATRKKAEKALKKLELAQTARP